MFFEFTAICSCVRVSKFMIVGLLRMRKLHSDNEPEKYHIYGECNGTARACVNSGYQALFSPITERLGTRLTNMIYSLRKFDTACSI